MEYKIINDISSARVPAWGNGQKYIAIHYLGVDGQNHDLQADGCGAHYYIYWDGTIYQRCSHDAIVWQVGTAGYYTQKHPEARNQNCIGIEMCCHCDGNESSAEDPYWYFTTETQNACVWLVQKLMQELGIPADHVLRHYDIVNKTCPAPYVHNNRYRTSWTWDEFKTRISAGSTLYRVRLRWDMSETQIGAYYVLDNAKAACPAGYSVYDESGKAIWTHEVTGTQARMLNGLPEAEKIMFMAPLYQKVAKETGLLASVGLAQFCLESGYGTTDLAQNANNLHGMKCSLSGNTWAGSSWDGVSKYTKKTQEQDKYGNPYYIDADFRAYPCMEDSIADRAAYYLGAMNGNVRRYPGIEKLTTAEEQIRAIKAGGYATDVNYVSKLMNLVNRFNLTQYDVPVTPAPAPEEPKEDTTMTIPSAADLVAAMKHLNTVMKADNKAGHQWRYYNGKRSENTFEKTRKAGKYYTNCMGGVSFAAKHAGVPGNALDWYGDKAKIHWLNENAEKNAKKYFDIIPVKTKTVKQCIADGTLRPGDVLTYMNLTHVNAYYAENKSFDTGHAFCDGSGEGAPYKKWIGTTPYKGYKVAYILRLKSKGVVYRVQINAYTRKVNADKCVAECFKKTGFPAFYELMGDNQYHVFCGSFESKANANDRVAAIRGAYPGAFVKEVNIS